MDESAFHLKDRRVEYKEYKDRATRNNPNCQPASGFRARVYWHADVIPSSEERRPKARECLGV